MDETIQIPLDTIRAGKTTFNLDLNLLITIDFKRLNFDSVSEITIPLWMYYRSLKNLQKYLGVYPTHQFEAFSHESGHRKSWDDYSGEKIKHEKLDWYGYKDLACKWGYEVNEDHYWSKIDDLYEEYEDLYESHKGRDLPEWGRRWGFQNSLDNKYLRSRDHQVRWEDEDYYEDDRRRSYRSEFEPDHEEYDKRERMRDWDIDYHDPSGLGSKTRLYPSVRSNPTSDLYPYGKGRSVIDGQPLWEPDGFNIGPIYDGKSSSKKYHPISKPAQKTKFCIHCGSVAKNYCLACGKATFIPECLFIEDHKADEVIPPVTTVIKPEPKSASLVPETSTSDKPFEPIQHVVEGKFLNPTIVEVKQVLMHEKGFTRTPLTFSVVNGLNKVKPLPQVPTKLAESGSVKNSVPKGVEKEVKKALTSTVESLKANQQLKDKVLNTKSKSSSKKEKKPKLNPFTHTWKSEGKVLGSSSFKLDSSYKNPGVMVIIESKDGPAKIGCAEFVKINRKIYLLFNKHFLQNDPALKLYFLSKTNDFKYDLNRSLVIKAPHHIDLAVIPVDENLNSRFGTSVWDLEPREKNPEMSIHGVKLIVARDDEWHISTTQKFGKYQEKYSRLSYAIDSRPADCGGAVVSDGVIVGIHDGSFNDGVWNSFTLFGKDSMYFFKTL
jgi:hypothetical protein